MVESTSNLSNWFRILGVGQGTTARLFCFPHAGSGPSVFNSWRGRLSEQLELIALAPPGREARQRESPMRNLDAFIAGLLPQMATYLDRPYAIFGHSLGGLVAWLTTHALQDSGLPLPRVLILSSCLPPSLMPRVQAHRPNAAMPVQFESLASDLDLFHSYRHVEREPLSCPLMLFGGMQDRDLPDSVLQQWQKETRGGFSLRLFLGGHFYWQEHPDFFLKVLARNLNLLTEGSGVRA